MFSFSLKRALYEKSPDFVKHTIGMVPFSMISGKAYRETMKVGEEMDTASPNEIERIQEHHLGKILSYCVDQVPFYRQFKAAFDKHRPLEALKAFPIIDKDTLQANFEQFLSHEKDSLPQYETTTGGTSGNQLKIIQENDSHYRETAFIHRLWSRVGYTTQSRKATFRGQVIQPKDANTFWQTNPIYRELQFSTFHMAPDNLDYYVQRLNKYQPHFLHGYPSAIAALAKHIVNNSDVRLNAKPRAAFLASEATFGEQRDTIEQGFGCRAFSFYGHSERLVLGGECEKNSTYHQFPDYGYVEIIKPDGKPAKVGESGEIVGTTFWNRIMPMIRYRTGDWATRLDSSCECGRHHFRFGDVQGRWNQEFLLGRSGAKTFSTALNMHGNAFDHVMRYQYIQNELGKLVVKIMPSSNFTDRDQRLIESELQQRIGHDFEIEVMLIKEIELTGRGKLRRIIQNVPDQGQRN